jgi:hypothetical protein
LILRTAFLALTAALCATWAAAEEAATLPTEGKPFPAKWEYSFDGGKTFQPEPRHISATRTPVAQNRVTCRAAFTVEDPARVGALTLHTHGKAGALTVSPAKQVDRYNVGSHPNLVRAEMKLNGTPQTFGALPYTLYKHFTIDPGLLRKGANTLEVNGVFWFAHGGGPFPASLRLKLLPPDVCELDRWPVLGAIYDDAFTLAARARIPVDFTVRVTPTMPAGPPTDHAFPRGRLLKAKVPLPKGTRTFRYAVIASAGGARRTVGPFDVTCPVRGPGLRFLVAGGTRIYSKHNARLREFFALLRERKPHLFVHTGHYQNCPAWDWTWNHDFLGHGREALARVPILPVCGSPEMISPVAFSRTFYFPPEDKDYGHWSYTVGPVRFVAIQAWAQAVSQNPAKHAKWLDEALEPAKEDYVIVLNGDVSHCHHEYAGRVYRAGIAHTRKHIDPILVKHGVTCTIGGYQQVYQRVEPPVDEGVATILSARAGGLGWAVRRNVIEKNAYSKAAQVADHFVEFEVRKDKLVMRAIAFDGTEIDKREFPPRRMGE